MSDTPIVIVSDEKEPIINVHLSNVGQGGSLFPGSIAERDAAIAQWDDAYSWGNHYGLYEVKDSTLVRYTDNDVCNWNIAFGWGDHHGLYALLSHAHAPVDLSEYTIKDTTDLDVTSLVSLLTGSITEHQLSIFLNSKIDESTVGWTEAKINLDQAIIDYNNGLLFIDAVDARIEVAEGDILISASRLDVVEGDIHTASIALDDMGIRFTVAEGAVNDHEARLIAQQEMSATQWTVKIQENLSDGSYYASGFGLLMYPDWQDADVIDLDEWVWFAGEAYRCVLAHVSSIVNQPPNATYWEWVPFGRKSQFGVLADSFFIQSASGAKTIPFLVDAVSGNVIFNADLFVDGIATFTNWEDIIDKPTDVDIYNVFTPTSWFGEIDPTMDNYPTNLWVVTVTDIDGILYLTDVDGNPLADADNELITIGGLNYSSYHLGQFFTNTITGRVWKFTMDGWIVVTDMTVAEALIQADIDALARINAARTEAFNYTQLWSEYGATVGAPVGTLIGSVAAGDIAYWSSDPAARINSHTTTINGGKITTGSVTAANIDVLSLRASILSAGVVIADHIVAGTITTLNMAPNSATDVYFVSGAGPTIMLVVTLTANYTVFLLGSFVQSVYSNVSFARNSTLLWAAAPRDATILTQGFSDSPGIGVHTYILSSSDGRNTSGASIYAVVQKI